MMPVVRGVIMRSTAAGSRLWVAGSISANTGTISCQCSACAVATNVYEGTITSPRRFSARIAISSAIVALHIATQCRTPAISAMRFSSSRTIGPLLVSQRLSRICSTRARKAARLPMFGRPTCSGSANAGCAPLIARSALPRMVLFGTDSFCLWISWPLRDDPEWPAASAHSAAQAGPAGRRCPCRSNPPCPDPAPSAGVASPCRPVPARARSW